MNKKTLKSIIIFILFLLISCKTTIYTIQEDDNCFYLNKGYIYLNFYNNSEKEMRIVNLSFIRRKGYYLSVRNFYINNDTLYIRRLTNEGLKITHQIHGSYIEYEETTLKVKSGESIQQKFKIDEEFKVIVLDSKIVLNKCDNNFSNKTE